MLTFQHTAARRRLDVSMRDDGTVDMFQHTAARRRLVADRAEYARDFFVSTHSRPKAAGSAFFDYYPEIEG